MIFVSNKVLFDFKKSKGGKNMFIRKKREGFTLVELLIVMAVIAALMGALVPVAISAIQHANATRVAENLQALVTQVQQYAYSEHKIPSISDLATSVSGGNINDYDIKPSNTSLSNTTSGNATFVVFYKQKSVTATQVQKVWSGAGGWNGSKFSATNTTSYSTPAAEGVIVKYW